MCSRDLLTRGIQAGRHADLIRRTHSFCHLRRPSDTPLFKPPRLSAACGSIRKVLQTWSFRRSRSDREQRVSSKSSASSRTSTPRRQRSPETLFDSTHEDKRAALIRLIFGGFTVSKDKSIAVGSNFSSGNLLAALRDIKTTTYNEKEAPERTSDSASSFMVERRGFEPLTPTLRT